MRVGSRRATFVVGAAATAITGYTFYSCILQHRTVRAEVFAGMTLAPHEEHPFPSPDPTPYASLGMYDEHPQHSKLIRFALPHSHDPVVVEGVSTVTVEDPADPTTPRTHYFPMYSEERRGYFDLLVWNNERDHKLYSGHKTGHDVVVRSGSVMLRYPAAASFHDVVIFVDPTGVPPAFQLLDEILRLDDASNPLPNVYVMYFKPQGWSTQTPLDLRLEKLLARYRKKSQSPEAEIQYVTSGCQEMLHSALRSLPESGTFVVGMMAEGAMRSLRQEHEACLLEKTYSGKRTMGKNKFTFLTIK